MKPVTVAVPGKGVMLVAILVIGGAVLLAVFTLFPRATIIVHPKTSERELTKDIVLDSKSTAPDYMRYALPAKIVTEEATVSKSFENAGGTTTEDFAKGTITFTNNQDQEQRLLPKTQMRHVDSGIIFLTDTPVAIPANGTLTVSVTAKEKGPAGDVPPGKFVIEKFSAGLQEAVPAQSDTAFSGGKTTDTEISQEALDAAQKTVLEQATKDATQKLTLQAGGAAIQPDLVTINVLSQNISASAGSKALSYTAHASVQARAFVIETHDLISLMTLALRANVASDEEFISYEASSFTLAIAQTEWEAGRARVTASLTGKYAKKIGSTELHTENLAGLSEKEVIDRFAASPNIGKVEVLLKPFWVTSVPSQQNQIDIRIENAK